MSEPTPTPAPPTPPPAASPSGLEGHIQTGVNVVKSLSLGNVLIIFLLVVIGIPVYTIWKALDDDKLMDRFMSTYEEISDQQTGCSLRHVQERGGPDIYSVSSGFAFQGNDRWLVSVILSSQPTTEQALSYCESLKLIAEKMLARGSARDAGGDADGVGQ